MQNSNVFLTVFAGIFTMTKDYKIILLDLDGTLLDTSPGIYNGYDYMTPKMGLPKMSDELKSRFVGPALAVTYPKYLGLTGERMSEAIEIYREYNNKQGYKEFEFYDGMDELLNYLKENGYITVVVTMKADKVAKRTLDVAGYTEKLTDIIGNIDYDPMTKAELIKLALDKYGLKKEEALLIGDTGVDASGAEEAQVDFYPAMYGFGFKVEDVTEDYPYVKKLNDPRELIEILEKEKQ